MKAAIVTAYWGEHALLMPTSLPTFMRHAERHGHTVVLAPPADPGLHFDWGKVAALRRLLPAYDAVIWVDGDCVILDDAPDLVQLVADHWMAVGNNCGGPGYCTSLWALRHDQRSLELLDELWQRRNDGTVDDQWFWWLGPPGEGANTLWMGQMALQQLSSRTTRTPTGVVHAASSTRLGPAHAARELAQVVDVSCERVERRLHLIGQRDRVRAWNLAHKPCAATCP